MRRQKRAFIRLLKYTGAYKIITGYLILFFIIAFVIMLFEPTITSYKDSLWYCFVSSTTIGFGDIAATSLVGRILTVVLYIFSIVVVAIITALITNLFIEAVKIRSKNSTIDFMDDLTRLPELTKEELAELSERIKQKEKENH